MENDILKFSYNWNSKLHCKVFTTVRLHNPKKYFKDKIFKIEAPGVQIEAKVDKIFTYKLNDIPEILMMLDTSYYKKEFIEIIEKMYKNSNVNVHTALFDVVLLKRIDQ